MVEASSVPCPNCQQPLPAVAVVCDRCGWDIEADTFEAGRQQPSSGQGEARADTKTCPYCAETIKAAAKVCRYGGWELEPASLANLPPSRLSRVRVPSPAHETRASHVAEPFFFAESTHEVGVFGAVAGRDGLCRGGRFGRDHGMVTECPSRLPQQSFQRLRCVLLQPWQHARIGAGRVTLAWPNRSATTLGCNPAASRGLALVWRKSKTRVAGTPARSQTRSKTRCARLSSR